MSDAELIAGGLLTIDEAAELAGVSRRQMYYYFDKGVPWFQTPSGRRRIPRLAVVALFSYAAVRTDRLAS